MVFQPLIETAPQNIAVAPSPREPLLPDPHDLPGVPAQSPTISTYAVVGIVASHHRGQMGLLCSKWLMPVGPAPLVHRGQCTRIAALGGDLPQYGLAIPRLAPDMGQAEEVERGTIRLGRVHSIWSSDAEVDEACLVGVEREPVPRKTLAQHGQDPCGILEMLEGHHQVIGVPDQGTSPS